jgi:RimJ/RimL family protein N-acetyltransferase
LRRVDPLSGSASLSREEFPSSWRLNAEEPGRRRLDAYIYEHSTVLAPLEPAQTAQLRGWFLPDAPGPLVGLHVLNTGHGAIFADRWPNPRTVLADTMGNYQLRGDPAALSLDDLRLRLSGFVDAPHAFEPVLRSAFPSLTVWPRVMLELPSGEPPAPEVAAEVRKLTPENTYQVWAVSPSLAWIADTWGGPPSLTAGGFAYGAFVDQCLVSVACSFFVGDSYEDIGVVTEPAFRRQNLSAACAAALCRDIVSRGRRPSWTTSLDNISSLAVARKLGFTKTRDDRLLVVGRTPPTA